MLTITGFLCYVWMSCVQDSDQVRPLAANADSVRLGTTQLVLETLDEGGQAVTTYEEGQNVVLSLSIINGAHTELRVDYWTFPITNAEFFRVYKYSNEGKLPVGKSFRLGGNTRDLSIQDIPAKSTATYRAPWIVTNSFYMPLINEQVPQQKARRFAPNDPPVQALQKGKYNTSFTLAIAGQPVTLSVDFTVD